MWFWRGTQSAIFYYVACTPCREWNYKRKRRKQADRTMKERNALEMEQPGIIQQPVPFQTNKYWAEEIAAGPGPPTGWTGHDKTSQSRDSNKRANSRPKRRSVFAPDQPPLSMDSGASGLPLNPYPEYPETSTRGAIKEGLKAAISPEKWNWIRHDRPDEILWGYEPLTRILKGKGKDDSNLGLSSHSGNALRRQRARSNESDASRDYAYATRHPEINDLHPPVVSLLPRSRSEVAWMLQPPPPAAVMEGKIHPDDAPIPPRPRAISASRPATSRKSPSPPAHRRERSRHRPPTIIISKDNSTPGTSIASSASSRESSRSPNRNRHRSLPPFDKKPINPRSSAIHGGRPALATIVSYDGTRILHPPRSPAFNSMSSSPSYPLKSPLPRDRMADDRSSEMSGTQTPPEWEFLLAQLYSPTTDGSLEIENLKSRLRDIRRHPGGPGNRSSWHGHERRWSEI